MSQRPTTPHPGKVTTIWPDGSVTEQLAADLPEADQFVATPDGPVPVVKIVVFAKGKFRMRHEYGPGNVLLRTATTTNSG
jgi:hypothetical protein